MKILFFIPSLNNGGAQKQLILNYLSFKNNNHDVKVLSLYNNHENPYLDLIDKNDLITLNKKKGKFFNFLILRNLYLEIKKFNVIHAYLAHSIYLVSIVKFFLNKNNNQVFVGGIRTDSKINDSFKIYLWNLFNELIFKFIDKFNLIDVHITPSESTKTSINKWVKKAPVVVIRNMYLNSLEKNRNIENPTFKFISSGRICDQKDQLFLINAFNYINQKDCILSIYGSIGDDNYFKEFNLQLSKFRNSNILYCGTYNEPAELFFRNFDALILTSKYEGFPNVVIEALSVGIPVLLPYDLINSEGLSSMVYTYKPGDYISFENNINEMKRDLLRGSTKNKEFKDNLAAEFSTLESSYELHLSLYQSFLSI